MHHPGHPCLKLAHIKAHPEDFAGWLGRRGEWLGKGEGLRGVISLTFYCCVVWCVVVQESLPGQINMVYIIEPAHFWSKKKAAHGHNKEKTKLEFSVC